MSEKKTLFKKMKVNKEILFNRMSIPSLIAKNLRVEGILVSTGTIEIEGKVKGDIKGDIVTLRETAEVEGTIKANIINIKGYFKGKAFSNKLNASKEAKLYGDINYCSLTVEDGALIEGQLRRSKDKIFNPKED
jgi:cytoskeletal protein CcmA (bactofilin family)